MALPVNITELYTAYCSFTGNRLAGNDHSQQTKQPKSTVPDHQKRKRYFEMKPTCTPGCAQVVHKYNANMSFEKQEKMKAEK